MLACRIWQEAEGTFTAISGDGRVQSALSSREADLDHPVILGRRFSVVAGAHYIRPFTSLHRTIAQRFPYLADPQHTDPELARAMDPKALLNTREKAFWRALLGLLSLVVSIGLAALLLRL